MRPALHAVVGRKPRFPATPLCLLLAMPAGAFAQSGSNAPMHLNPLVVTASGHAQDVKEAPASITVITRQDLEEKRASSIAEALQDVEGVDVGAAVGKTGGMNISIRGMPSEYTLILIDGRRQNVAGDVTPNGFGETQTSFMPPVSAIERIEVIRGPMATLYGSDAIGGVINIITRKVSDRWTGSVTTEATINEDRDYGDSRAISLYTSGPLVKDKLGIQLRGRLFDRDKSEVDYIADDGTPGQVSPRGPAPVKADIYNIGGRLTFTPSKEHEFWLDAERTEQNYDNSEEQLGTHWDPGDTHTNGGYGTKLGFNRTQVALGYNARLGFGDLETSISQAVTEKEGREIPPSQPNAGAPRKIETENLIVDAKLVMPIGESHITTLGGQWWDAELTDGLVPGKMNQSMWSVFAEDEWLLTDRLALTLGARQDEHDAFGGHFSPRAYLVWSATDNWTFKGGVSSAYKTPRVDQLSSGIVNFRGQGDPNSPVFGNPELKPETSRTVELSASYDTYRFGAGISIFYNDFDDRISSVRCTTSEGLQVPDCVGQPSSAWTYVNIEEAVTRGIELSTRYRLANNWLLTANYTYIDSEIKSGSNRGNPLSDTPEHRINAKLRWTATERLAAWISGEYSSERYRSDADARAVLGDYKEFALFHAGLGYKLAKNITLNATIYNLADKDFVDYRRYGPDADQFSNVYVNPEPGRRLWLSATYEF